MQRNLIIIYLLIFLSVIILLKMLGVMWISNNELLGYALIVYGLSLFYSSFIHKRKIFLFIGSVLFLAGLLLFVIENFEFENTDRLILPSSVFVLSISSFMVYLSDTQQKLIGYLSAILLAAGMGITALISTQGIPGFFGNVVAVAGKYWTIIVILIIVIILVSKESQEKDQEK